PPILQRQLRESGFRLSSDVLQHRGLGPRRRCPEYETDRDSRHSFGQRPGGSMHFDGYVALAGLVVGFTVGLTGMGGGAIMTPILVLLFKIQPLAAVSSDLVAAVVMKPVGGGVHLRHGTVNRQLVKWLMIGSVPSAFLGVLVL